MKIVITGSAGFIGTNLTKTLLNLGHEIIGIDNLSSGQFSNIKRFKDKSNFDFYKDNISSSNFQYLNNIDQIYNLACQASPKKYQKNPLDTLQVNTRGIFNICKQANKFNAKLLQASTSEIYGNPKQHPQSESYWGNVNPIGPRSCYDEGKRCAESILRNVQKQYGVKIKIVRIFNTYGPYMNSDDGRVISNFINQALNGEPLTIYGAGNQTRSFCYISDLTNGLIKIMKTDQNFITPINLGNPSEVSILELSDIINQIMNRNTDDIIFQSLPEDDPLRRKPNIDLIRKKLDWKPSVSLREGLKRTVNYYDRNQG